MTRTRTRIQSRIQTRLQTRIQTRMRTRLRERIEERFQREECANLPRPIAGARRVATVFVTSALWLSVAPSADAGNRIDLDLYDALLAQYTRATDDIVSTRVDYAGLRREARWRELVAQLEASRPAALEARTERLAFWINAYNVLAIETVVRNYPVEGIKDVGSFFNPVWDQTAARIDGKGVTLGQIEHEILRPMGEPRIHAAIVCASVSCPALARTAFRAERLEEQLDRVTRRWLANQRKGAKVDRKANRITLSRIFDWFSSDFDRAGGVLRFVASHLPDDGDRRFVEANLERLRVAYFDYDWSLNDLSSKR